ncbi:hypothetical protein KVR01_001812 [Diaporthe batatas]|uniref:uncharacterized protein n=1 Tax=Diaporthe batatas TaxID=748121 RepID=UPI001D04375E|nr:uncharacterized protein KVR01_001812 [Diaporthe batatas]KAG8169063.1 hypothetical protein KVR01_001812 [Diaporthe batatas]
MTGAMPYCCMVEVPEGRDFATIDEAEAERLLATYPQPPWIRREWHEQITGFRLNPVVWYKDLDADNEEPQDHQTTATDSRASSSPSEAITPIPINIMSGYESNQGAMAMRKRREGKATAPSTPVRGNDDKSDSDAYIMSTPSRPADKRRGGVHHSAAKTPSSIGQNEQLTSKVLSRLKETTGSPAGTIASPSKGSGRSRNTSGQFAQEHKVLDNDLKVKVNEMKVGTMELQATDYNALLSANDCLEHLAEHAGQSLSQWKNTMFAPAVDFPLMAKDCQPHVQALQTKMRSVVEGHALSTNTTPVVIDDSKKDESKSKYHQALMEVDHAAVVEDLAKYKLLNKHLAGRIVKLEGEENVCDWPVVVLYGTANSQEISKVEVLGRIHDQNTDVEYPFSHLSDNSSIWFLPAKFVIVI